MPASAVALASVAIASAAWGGSDPAKNIPSGKLPVACKTEPAGKKCVNAGVYYLDKARSRVHLPPYALPADFPSLSPPQQLFILVNLDRVQYGLPPIPGLTVALNHDALATTTSASEPAMKSERGLGRTRAKVQRGRDEQSGQLSRTA